MTHEHAAFLRAIIESPADDLPRLVYADYLDENAGTMACPRCEAAGLHWKDCGCRCMGNRVSNGNAERAEFIRVQCELANWEPEQSLENEHRKEKLVRREAELLPQFIPDWKFTAILRRGFVAEVRLSLAALFGGVCERCEGIGLILADQYQWSIARSIDCPDCHGTGRTTGCAAELFANHPIERVVLICREPAEIAVNLWAWSQPLRNDTPADFAVNRHAVPDAIWPTGVYSTRAIAIDALSDEICRWGRALAFPSAVDPLNSPSVRPAEFSILARNLDSLV